MPRQGVELGLREGRPDLVAALQVVEPVVGRVVADFPQAVGGHRGQEGDPAEDGVELRVVEEAAVAGVMTDEEQPHDGGRDDASAEQFQREAGGEQDERGAGDEEPDVEQEYQRGQQQRRRLFERTQQGLPVPGGRLHCVARLGGAWIDSADATARADAWRPMILHGARRYPSAARVPVTTRSVSCLAGARKACSASWRRGADGAGTLIPAVQAEVR